MAEIWLVHKLTKDNIRNAFDHARDEGKDFLITHTYGTPDFMSQIYHETAAVSRKDLVSDLFTLYRESDDTLNITSVYDPSRPFEDARGNTDMLPQYEYKAAQQHIKRDLIWKEWESRSFFSKLFSPTPRT